jgi:hypothetical protein
MRRVRVPRLPHRGRIGLGAVSGILWLSYPGLAQTPSGAIETPVEVPLNHHRILGVIPDYQTVENSSQPVAPMTVKEKWHLLLKENTDPFNFASAAFGAGWSQADHENPNYGLGTAAYAERFAAALADGGTQSLFSTGFLACVLHQDPRYFRKGPSSGFPTRVLYSLSRIVITRNDSGVDAFNSSNLGGMVMGIAASNLYYPPASRSGTVMVSRIGTSLFGDAMGNLMSEFWPDVRDRLFHNNRLFHKRNKGT